MKRFVLIALIVFIADVITKQFVRISGFRTDNGLVDVTYITNTGSLFSLFEGGRASNLIFIILSVVALFFLFRYVNLEAKPVEHIPLGLLVAGILGNLIDRVFFGAVIDWVNLYWWPIFNVADAAIVIGVCWMLLLVTREYMHKPIKN